jgi:dUTP pyrophosphatase
MTEVKFRKFDPSRKTNVPVYTTEGSAGLDLCSAEEDTIILSPNESVLVGTNLLIELPEGYEGQVRPRSGLALKHGITVLNSPGTVDSDYRGEVKVLLINHGKNSFEINFGDRIAQLVISKYERITFVQSDLITETRRGEGGYGSTGINSKSDIK